MNDQFKLLCERGNWFSVTSQILIRNWMVFIIHLLKYLKQIF